MTLAEARALLAAGTIPVDICFATYSDTRNTGGKRITLRNAYMVQGSDDSAHVPATIADKDVPVEQKVRKNPNHFVHGTFNARVSGSPDITKVYWIFIESINGKMVLI